MCRNNFRHYLSTTLMPQTFEGFNNLCTKAHDIEIQLNKRNKSTKESGGKTGRLLSLTIIPREKAPCNLGSSSSKELYVSVE